jgi:U4/U6 small nuclear ribonucleoprotein PRP4
MPGGYGEALKSAAAHAASSKEIFYSPAIEQLIEARKRLCEFSFPRTHERILRTKRVRENESLQIEEDRYAAQSYVHAKTLALEGSQFADYRPLSCVRFSPDGSLVAVGSWTGSVKLWDSESLERVDLLGGHIERVTSVSWQPALPEGERTDNSLGLLASSSADGTCRLWDCRSVNRSNRHIEKALPSSTQSISNGDESMELVESHPQVITTSTIASQSQSSLPTSGARRLSVLRGHQGGLTKCCFHPSGKYVGTSGLDFTWRLWDVETSTELQLQDGHIRECNAIDFHQDGSLTATGDTGGVILVWDVRSGQSIQAFQGHIKKIASLHWNQNGFQLASGSTDNTVKIWDLRSKKCSYTLPAHSNVLSEARFSSSGELLLTSSFDGQIKLWNTRNYDILKTLSGHNGKIMCCDIAPDERRIISGGYDRTIKLWKKAT